MGKKGGSSGLAAVGATQGAVAVGVLEDGAEADEIGGALLGGGNHASHERTLLEGGRRYLVPRPLPELPPAGFEPATLGLGNRCSIP